MNASPTKNMSTRSAGRTHAEVEAERTSKPESLLGRAAFSFRKILKW